jgi:probable HAF family extracellular repeat protein
MNPTEDVAAATTTTYKTIDLGTLGGRTSVATAINAAGQIVGYSENANGKIRAFIWTNGVMRGLGHLGGGQSWAYGVNKRGQVVGHSITAAQEQHAFIWTNGVMKDLGTLGGGNSSAIGIDSSGTVVVGSSETDKEWPWETHAVQWKNGQIIDLFQQESWIGGITPDAKRMAGTRPAPGPGPFLWTSGNVVNLNIPGGAAFALNSSGQVVGFGWEGEFEYAFLWDKGVITDLGTLGGRESTAYGINEVGQVVGGSDNAAGKFRAFIWTDGVMKGLGTLGGNNSIASGVNRAGHVVGQAQTASGATHATLWKRQ